MAWLERQQQLAELEAAIDRAALAHGRLIFLSGQAGKTLLVRHLTEAVEGRATVLIGACDALSTPRPLGSLQDIAGTVGGELARALALDGARERAFSALLSLLRNARRPVLVVFEDVHWADEATLDLLRYIGRRIEYQRGVLIVTYRDDELGTAHPLRVVVGDPATSPVTQRMRLDPLSLEAVRHLARGSGIDPNDLYRQTGGNPLSSRRFWPAGRPSCPTRCATRFWRGWRACRPRRARCSTSLR
jgi:predicted ATPase